MLKRSNLKFKWIDLKLISSFDDFYYFYLVVKHGGFSAASEAENISKSKLSRRIIDLENKFNVSLIQRTTRHFKVTDLGQEFYEECCKVIAQVECAENVFKICPTHFRCFSFILQKTRRSQFSFF